MFSFGIGCDVDALTSVAEEQLLHVGVELVPDVVGLLFGILLRRPPPSLHPSSTLGTHHYPLVLDGGGGGTPAQRRHLFTGLLGQWRRRLLLPVHRLTLLLLQDLGADQGGVCRGGIPPTPPLCWGVNAAAAAADHLGTFARL